MSRCNVQPAFFGNAVKSIDNIFSISSDGYLTFFFYPTGHIRPDLPIYFDQFLMNQLLCFISGKTSQKGYNRIQSLAMNRSE